MYNETHPSLDHLLHRIYLTVVQFLSHPSVGIETKARSDLQYN